MRMRHEDFRTCCSDAFWQLLAWVWATELPWKFEVLSLFISGSAVGVRLAGVESLFFRISVVQGAFSPFHSLYAFVSNLFVILKSGRGCRMELRRRYIHPV